MACSAINFAFIASPLSFPTAEQTTRFVMPFIALGRFS